MYQPSDSFILPEDLDAPIWRYLTLPKLLDLVACSRLFFCRSDRFTDNIEGTFPLADVRRWSTVAAQSGIESALAVNILQHFYMNKQLMYMNCWHIADGPSTRMWEEYIGDTNGALIESTTRRLIESFRSVESTIFVGKVNYLEYSSEILPSSIWAIYFSKMRKFEHENELRVLYSQAVHGDRPMLYSDLPDPGIYFHIDLSTLVRKICLHSDACPWFIEALTKVLKEFNVQSPLVKIG